MTTCKKDSLIQFPCDFMVKVIGKASSTFEELIINIVLRHYPDTDLLKMTKRLSRDHNFITITVTVPAKNKTELDALYQELSNTKVVLFVL